MRGPEYGDHSRGFRQTIRIYTQNGIPLRPVYRARVCCVGNFGLSARSSGGGTSCTIVGPVSGNGNLGQNYLL